MGNPGNTQNQCAPKRYGFVTSFVDNGGNPNTAGTEYVVQTNDGKPDSTFYHPDPASSLTSDTIFHTFLNNRPAVIQPLLLIMLLKLSFLLEMDVVLLM